MRIAILAATIALLAPFAASACDMAYAACRHDDSGTDKGQQKSEKKKAEPKIGWPGINISIDGSGNYILHDNRLPNGFGRIVSYDARGTVYVSDRYHARMALSDPSKPRLHNSFPPVVAGRRAFAAPAETETTPPVGNVNEVSSTTENQPSDPSADGPNSSPTDSGQSPNTDASPNDGSPSSGGDASPSQPAENSAGEN